MTRIPSEERLETILSASASLGRVYLLEKLLWMKPLPSSFFSSCLPSTRSLPDCTETFNSSGLYLEASILTSILLLSSSTLASSLLNKLLNSLNWLSRFLLGTIQSSFHLLLKKELSKALLMLKGERCRCFLPWFLVWL